MLHGARQHLRTCKGCPQPSGPRNDSVSHQNGPVEDSAALTGARGGDGTRSLRRCGRTGVRERVPSGTPAVPASYSAPRPRSLPEARVPGSQLCAPGPAVPETPEVAPGQQAGASFPGTLQLLFGLGELGHLSATPSLLVTSASIKGATHCKNRAFFLSGLHSRCKEKTNLHMLYVCI